MSSCATWFSYSKDQSWRHQARLSNQGLGRARRCRWCIPHLSHCSTLSFSAQPHPHSHCPGSPEPDVRGSPVTTARAGVVTLEDPALAAGAYPIALGHSPFRTQVARGAADKTPGDTLHIAVPTPPTAPIPLLVMLSLAHVVNDGLPRVCEALAWVAAAGGWGAIAPHGGLRRTCVRTR